MRTKDDVYNDLVSVLRERVKYQKDKNLLLEAYRRYVFFSLTEPLDACWLGLGYPSAYKSEYFKPLDDKPTPRVNNWWLLTDKGVIVLQEMLKVKLNISKREMRLLHLHLF